MPYHTDVIKSRPPDLPAAGREVRGDSFPQVSAPHRYSQMWTIYISSSRSFQLSRRLLVAQTLGNIEDFYLQQLSRQSAAAFATIFRTSSKHMMYVVHVSRTRTVLHIPFCYPDFGTLTISYLIFPCIEYKLRTKGLFTI